MPRKEGPFSHGETLSPAEQHRLDGEGPAEDRLFHALEKQFGPDVVDDPARAAELRQRAIRARLAATVEFQPTPEKLREYREQEFDIDQTMPFSPLSGMVDVPTDTQFPPDIQPQNMQEPICGSQQ